MTEPLSPPRKKNPIERTRRATLPPEARSRTALGLTRAAAEGRFEMQVCADCASVNYPPREVCVRCLSPQLAWREVDNAGLLLATTVVRHSNVLYFRERAPWRIGTVQMDAGPAVLAHLHDDCQQGQRVRLSIKLDRSGQAVLQALPITGTPNMQDAKAVRESSCDPKFRRVLVTDAKSPLGMAIVRELLAAGASLVFAGDPQTWKTVADYDRLLADADNPANLPKTPTLATPPAPAIQANQTHPPSPSRVQAVELDVTSTDSVDRLAASIGGKVDILINTAEYLRDGGVLGRKDVLLARDALDVNVLGLMRLAQAFGPGLGFRGADGTNSATAWVNILSIYAYSSLPHRGAWSASKAAALSVAQCLRAELRASGVRVLNVFPGPMEESFEQLTLPPKLAPSAVAKALVQALRDGTEDVYVGDVAEEFRQRLRDNAKGLEREMAAGGAA